jgi:hypothetical protein
MAKGRISKIRTPDELGEPFRTFKELEKLAERGRASYCFFETKIRRRKYEDVGKSLGVSRQRVEHLIKRAKTEYYITKEDFRHIYLTGVDNKKQGGRMDK